MNRALARLAFTRSFPLAWTLFALVLTLLLASADAPGSAAGNAALGSLGLDPQQIERALSRQNTWTALLVIWLPGLLFLAASTAPGWRRGEVAWLAGAAIGRGRILASTWLGGALAGALILLTCAVVAEVHAGEGPPARRLAHETPTPRVVLLAGDPARIWQATPPAAARTLRVPLVAVVGGALPHVRLSVRRTDEPPGATGATRHIERAVAGRVTCEVPLPPGTGPLEVRLERLGEADEDGAGVAVLGAAVFTTPAASERLASVALLARAWLALCAWGALALALGTWFSGATAALGTLAVAIATWMSDSAPTWLPGRGIGRALEVIGEGFVPASLGAPEVAAAAGCVLLGLALGRAGLGTWRRA